MENWPGAIEESCGHYAMIPDVILEHASNTSEFLTE
jgi:hypothetical protein